MAKNAPAPVEPTPAACLEMAVRVACLALAVWRRTAGSSPTEIVTAASEFRKWASATSTEDEAAK